MSSDLSSLGLSSAVDLWGRSLACVASAPGGPALTYQRDHCSDTGLVDLPLWASQTLPPDSGPQFREVGVSDRREPSLKLLC